MKIAVAAAVLAAGASFASADVIAYWGQNNNGLPDTTFGYLPSAFPQAADQGAGTWDIANFDGTLKANGSYDFVESFAGNALGSLDGVSGGSFSFEGAQNNGAQVILTVDATNFESLTLQFARRGTSTGYNFLDVSYRNATGGLTSVGTLLGTVGSTWELRNFSFGSALDGLSSAEIVITFDGATSANGNQRLDNVLIEGTLIPTPGSLALLGLGGLAAARRRR
jgi:hypothetical protein